MDVPQDNPERNAERGQAMEKAAAEKAGSGALHDRATAQRRLLRDLKSLNKSLASQGGDSMGIAAHPVDSDIFHWHAVIAGPDGTAWEGGVFRLDVQFSDTYPVAPPHVRFLTKNVFHPNVYVDGNICLDTLKSCWSASLDVEALLLSLRSLLADPNPNSAANGAAATLLVENRELYNKKIAELVEASLEQEFSDNEDEAPGKSV